MCYFPWGATLASRIFVVVADLASQKVSFHSPRYEIYGGTNNSVLNFYPASSLFLCLVTYICGFYPAMNIIIMHTNVVVCKHAISLEVCCHTYSDSTPNTVFKTH